MKIRILILFIVAYIIIYASLFKGFIFNFNPDATGYLSVAEKIARGEYYNSINGIWSPLGSWILAPFIRAGINGILMAKYLNGLYGLICLVLFFKILNKLKVYRYFEILILGAVTLILIEFAYSNLFGDLLALTFLLGYLLLVSSINFFENYFKIFCAALLGALAFYAKAYSFYFILLHLPLTIFFLQKRKTSKAFSFDSFRKAIFALFVLLFISSFWIIALKIKYGQFILGQKNVTGTLTELYKPVARIIQPPELNDYAVFDDISSVYPVNLTAFSNSKLFLIQLKLIVNNVLLTLNTFTEFSVFFWAIILCSIYLLFDKKLNGHVKNLIFILLLFNAIWVSGYMFFSVQNRFFWMTNIVIIYSLGIIISQKKGDFRQLEKILLTFIILSFYVYPFTYLKKNYNSGKTLHEISKVLITNNVKGNLLFSFNNNNEFSNAIMLNYLLKSKFYGTYSPSYTTENILIGVKDYSISHYIYYYSTPTQKEDFLTGKLCKNAKSVFSDLYPGIVLLNF